MPGPGTGNPCKQAVRRAMAFYLLFNFPIKNRLTKEGADR